MCSLGYTNLTSIEESYNKQNGIVSLSSYPKDESNLNKSNLNEKFISIKNNIKNESTNNGEITNDGGMMNGGMMNSGMMNGMNGSAFHLESGNKPFKSSNTYYSSLMEKSQKTTLGNIFFSNPNKNIIISKLKGKIYNIDKNMSDEYDEYIRKDIYNTKSQNDVLNNLNKKVIEKCIKSSYMNEKSNTKYMRDITTLAPPMSYPKSTNNSSTLEFKRFF